MSTATDLIQRLYAAMETNDAQTIRDCVRPDVELRHPAAPPTRGSDALVQLVAQQMAAFSNAQFIIARLVDAGDTVVVEHAFQATQTGALPGPNGPVEGTGRQIRLDSCDVIQLEAGRVKSFHAYLDTLSLLGQLGLMAPPVARLIFSLPV
jgi:ketosteroid isomerase-like protein